MVFGWGGNGFGGNCNAGEQPVTEAGLCNAMNFNGLENAVGRLSDRQGAIVRNQCCDSTSTLTLIATSATVPATVTIDNTAVVVTKL